MSNEFDENNFSIKMNKSIHSFKKEISTLRTGRANTKMLDTIKLMSMDKSCQLNN